MLAEKECVCLGYLEGGDDSGCSLIGLSKCKELGVSRFRKAITA